MPEVFELTFTVRSIGRQPAHKLCAALQTLCQGTRELYFAGGETSRYTGPVSATSELGEELARRAGESRAWLQAAEDHLRAQGWTPPVAAGGGSEAPA